MPEGPEVAVVVDSIQAATKLTFQTAEIIKSGKQHRFSRNLIPNWGLLQQPWRIREISCKGKLIYFRVEILASKEQWYFLSTLGMTGDWQLNAARQKHAKFCFVTDTGDDLTFVDTRAFGTFRITNRSGLEAALKKIGQSLLVAPVPESEWTALKKHYKLKDLPIGEALLTQNFFSGVGNIYKSELLYRLRIDPRLTVGQLTPEIWNNLNREAHTLLQTAYQLKGCSVVDFTANGEEGQAQQLLQVYSKTHCPYNHPIQKLRQKSGSLMRTTWWCPECVNARLP